MKYYAIFALLLISSVYAKEFHVPSDGKLHMLRPDTSSGLVRTEWNLISEDGTKMALTCIFFGETCDDAKVNVNNGDANFELCPGARDMGFTNTSLGNSMNVIIENVGPKMKAYCQVQATKPYLGIVEHESIDRAMAGYGMESKSKEKPSCRCGWSNKSPQRIIGGTHATLHEFPFVVRIKESAKASSFCGGSIITNKVILTAAHCIYRKRKRVLSVLIGEHDLSKATETNATKEIKVEQIIVHDEFDPFSNFNDISLLVLQESIEFSNQVGPVCLPSVQENLDGQYIKVIGWGLTKDISEGGRSSAILRKVNLRVIDLDVCKVIYDIDPVNRKQICTFNYPKDSCAGDSGGPLVHVNAKTNMFQQVALVSYGRRCGFTDPSVNTDVAYFMDWIQKTIPPSEELCY